MSTNGFLYWGMSEGAQTVAVPYPDRGAAPFLTTRAVSAGRNADNVVVGEKVGRSNDKQSMKWSKISCEKWWEMNRFVEENSMFFWCHYFNHNLGRWMDRLFYCGDFTCNPEQVNAATGKPAFYSNCSVNVIDTGEGV